MKNLKGILENYSGKAAFALPLLAVEVKALKLLSWYAYSGKMRLLITIKDQLKACFFIEPEPIFHLYCGGRFLFLQRVAATSGIMVGKYPETPGKLSTLSTMLYKQIVHKLLSLGKSEVDKL